MSEVSKRDIQYEMDVVELMYINGEIDDKEYDRLMDDLITLANKRVED